jgi:hypothetical protein
MAQGDIMDEAMGFCTEYMQHCFESERRVWDDKEEPAMNSEVIERNERHRLLPDELRLWIYEFVLNIAEPLQVYKEQNHVLCVVAPVCTPLMTSRSHKHS